MDLPTLVDTVHVHAILFDVLIVTGPSAVAGSVQTDTTIHVKTQLSVKDLVP